MGKLGVSVIQKSIIDVNGNGSVIVTSNGKLYDVNGVEIFPPFSEQRYTAYDGVCQVLSGTTLLTMGGTGATTVVFPASPANGQKLTITLETAYNHLTLSPSNGAAIVAATIGHAIGSFGTWAFCSSGSVWRRVG